MLRSTPLRSEDYIVKHRYFASPERWGTLAGKGSKCLDLPPLRSEDCMVKHKYFASPERWGTFAGKGSRCLDLPPLGARIVW